jgi:hypothetical protein
MVEPQAEIQSVVSSDQILQSGNELVPWLFSGAGLSLLMLAVILFKRDQK